MNYKLLLNTLVHLKPTQVVWQVKNRLCKPKFERFEVFDPSASSGTEVPEAPGWATEPIPRPKCTDGDKFTFINIPSEFTDWNDPSRGMLWAYNQNYFDFVNQSPESLKGSSSSKGLNGDKEYGLYWIDKFIAELPQNKVGLDPYPIALRGINWIKFFGRYPECATKERVDSLWSQYKLLEKKLEYHLLANHLLEDAFSLFIGACYFQDSKMKVKAYRLLLEQLKEQTLEDGAHYEQSVMYHSILLDRLLDCVNLASGFKFQVSSSNGFKFQVPSSKGSKFQVSSSKLNELKGYASRMLGWLEAMCYEDGTWPFFNDAALGIAPTPKEIFDYAKRLGIEWRKTELKDSGYRSLKSKVEGQKSLEVMVDVGNITATYQPGHTHADSLNYELRIEGKPFIVDTGISTYNKTPRRQYERSTIAHNCVVPADNYGTDSSQSSSQVWGGFRVGKRCKVSLIKDSANEVSACHNGFAKPCSRTFRIVNDAFIVEDQYDGNAISLIHLAQEVEVQKVVPQAPREQSSEQEFKSSKGFEIQTNLGSIVIEGASKIEVVDEKYSVEYNRFLPCKVMKIYFTGKLKYTIR